MTTLSSVVSFREATGSKMTRLLDIAEEYRRVVNCFIDILWELPPHKGHAPKELYTRVGSTLIVRHVRAAFDEARGIVNARRASRELELATRSERAQRLLDRISKCSNPIKKRRMEKNLGEFYDVRLRRVRRLKKISKPYKNDLIIKTSESVELLESETPRFDYWLRVNRMKLPVMVSDHFRELLALPHSKRSGYYRIDPTKKTLTVCFELQETRPDPSATAIGLDTGIIRMATLSDGTFLGEDNTTYIAKRRRKLQGSKGSIRAKREHHHYINKLAKDIIKRVVSSGATALVIEDLNNILRNKKGFVRSKWMVSLFHERLTTHAMRDRVALVRVWPSYTSQTCYQCGHVDKGNRNGLIFSCMACGHHDDADVNAAKNIRKLGLKSPGNPLLPVITYEGVVLE